jgi:TfoX/Sxy family transcriptional regulator of competence genes
MPKPTDADRDRFRDLVPDDPRVEIKPMFGQLAAFVNGNMFFGLFGSSLGVKLAADDLAALMASGGTPFGPDERPMAGYATLPDGDAAPWVQKALDHVGAMPAKQPKKK